MPCLLGCLALGFPRLVIILLVIFSDYIGRGFNGGVLLPLLGFFFLPLTTLAYAFAINDNGSVSGIYLVLLIFAVLIDVGMLGGGGWQSRRQVTVIRREGWSGAARVKKVRNEAR